jgi:hypothetical protein
MASIAHDVFAFRSDHLWYQDVESELNQTVERADLYYSNVGFAPRIRLSERSDALLEPSHQHAHDLISLGRQPPTGYGSLLHPRRSGVPAPSRPSFSSEAEIGQSGRRVLCDVLRAPTSCPYFLPDTITVDALEKPTACGRKKQRLGKEPRVPLVECLRQGCWVVSATEAFLLPCTTLPLSGSGRQTCLHSSISAI